VDQCGKAGIKGIKIISAGFKEIGAARANKRLPQHGHKHY